MGKFLDSVANAFANSNPIGTGVGLAFNSIGSLFQNRSNKHRQQEAFAQQEKMQALQNAYNTRMWHMSNDYNSPANQMRLFKEAGLNPNLIYGQMSDISSSPMHSGSGAAPGFARMENVMGSVDPRTVSETNALNAQAEKTRAEAKNIEQDTVTKMTFNQFAEEFYSGQVTMQNVSINNVRADTNVKSAQVSKLYNECSAIQASIRQINETVNNMRIQAVGLRFDNYLKNLDAAFSSQTLNNRVRQVASEADVSEKVARTFMWNLAAQIGLMKAQAFAASTQGSLNLALTGESYSRSVNNSATFHNINAHTSMLNSMGAKFSAEKDSIRFHLNMDKRFLPWERTLGVANASVAGLEQWLTLPSRVASTNLDALFKVGKVVF